MSIEITKVLFSYEKFVQFQFYQFFFIVLKLNFQIYNITFYVALIAYFENLDSCKL